MVCQSGLRFVFSKGLAGEPGVEDGEDAVSRKIGIPLVSLCQRPIKVCRIEGTHSHQTQGCGEEGSGCAENQGHLGEPLLALKISVATAAMAFGKG